MVFIGHFSDSIPFFSKHGGLGVDLFFVLSGFLVSDYLVIKIKNKEYISYTKFIIRRAFKILPSYYFFLLFGFFISYIFTRSIAPEQIITISELPQYLFFYRNYGGLPQRLTFEHVWSLCVEEHFYLLLPLLFIVVRRIYENEIKWLKILTVLIIVAGILIKLSSWINLFAEHPTYTHNRIDGLAWGVLLRLLINSQFLIDINKTKCFYAGLLLFTFSIMIESQTSYEFYWFFFIHSIAPFSFVLMIIGAYAADYKWLFPLRVIAYFSYNLYLWHFIILIPVKYYFGSDFTGFIVYIIISVLLTISSTFLVEEPFLKLRKKIITQ